MRPRLCPSVPSVTRAEGDSKVSGSPRVHAVSLTAYTLAPNLRPLPFGALICTRNAHDQCVSRLRDARCGDMATLFSTGDMILNVSHWNSTLQVPLWPNSPSPPPSGPRDRPYKHPKGSHRTGLVTLILPPGMSLFLVATQCTISNGTITLGARPDSAGPHCRGTDHWDQGCLTKHNAYPHLLPSHSSHSSSPLTHFY